MHTSPHIIAFIHLYPVAVKMHCKVLLCRTHWPSCSEITGKYWELEKLHQIHMRVCEREACFKNTSSNDRTSSRTGTEEASILLHNLTSSFYPTVSLLWRSFSVSGATLGNCQFVEGFLQKATSAIKQQEWRNILTAESTRCRPSLELQKCHF